jgi:heme A synthase
MQFILALHFNLVPLIWLCGGLATIWGIVLLIRKRGIDRVMRILLGVTAGLGVLQAALGGLLFLFGARPSDPLHYVYGLLVLAAIPVAYTYADNKSARRDMIVFTIAAVVVVAAAVRAFMTGGGPLH